MISEPKLKEMAEKVALTPIHDRGIDAERQPTAEEANIRTSVIYGILLNVSDHLYGVNPEYLLSDLDTHDYKVARRTSLDTGEFIGMQLMPTVNTYEAIFIPADKLITEIENDYKKTIENKKENIER